MKVAGNRAKDILLIFLCVLAAMLFRRYDAFSNPQLWAEDGKIFLQQYEQTGIRSLFTPYAGYLHLAIRLVALLFGACRVNYLYIPACYNLSAFFITFLVALQLYRSAGFAGMKHKILYAVIFVFLPIGPEVFMNMTNILWITALYLVDFLFIGYKRYEQANNKAWKLLLIVVISLTGPFSLLLSPVVLLYLFVERKTMSRRRLAPMLLIVTCGLVQLWFLAHSAKGFNRTTVIQPENYHLWKLVRYNISDLAFLRNSFLPAVPGLLVTPLCILLFAGLLTALYAGYRRISIARKYVLPLSAMLLLGSFIYSFWPMESYTNAFAVPRYYFVTYTCMAWIFIAGPGRKMSGIYALMYGVYILL